MIDDCTYFCIREHLQSLTYPCVTTGFFVERLSVPDLPVSDNYTGRSDRERLSVPALSVSDN
ncbi:hypothetical protein DPMN_154444 [Dreissena polymorpha]|uniref:Uncharacterized protein n=1 Tax=Dreissena polymorpha TaxID=45954 RepID=A0A9D4FPY5_DREPO|nr:hypothetical protein DPMN_154444 [Dreissena polymorpha]